MEQCDCFFDHEFQKKKEVKYVELKTCMVVKNKMCLLPDKIKVMCHLFIGLIQVIKNAMKSTTNLAIQLKVSTMSLYKKNNSQAYEIQHLTHQL